MLNKILLKNQKIIKPKLEIQWKCWENIKIDFLIQKMTAKESKYRSVTTYWISYRYVLDTVLCDTEVIYI